MKYCTTHFRPGFLHNQFKHACIGCAIAFHCLKVAIHQQRTRPHLILRPTCPWALRWVQVLFCYLNDVGAGWENDNSVGLREMALVLCLAPLCAACKIELKDSDICALVFIFIILLKVELSVAGSHTTFLLWSLNQQRFLFSSSSSNMNFRPLIGNSETPRRAMPLNSTCHNLKQLKHDVLHEAADPHKPHVTVLGSIHFPLKRNVWEMAPVEECTRESTRQTKLN